MIAVEGRSTAAVVPFPGTSDRRARAAPEAGEPRGEILLFTGVRYERQPEPTPTPKGPGLARGRRRRS